jgi:hypothetical protein
MCRVNWGAVFVMALVLGLIAAEIYSYLRTRHLTEEIEEYLEERRRR